MADLKAELRGILSRCGQEHVLRFFDDLDDVQKRTLAEQVRSIDFQLLDELSSSDAADFLESATIEPADYIELPENGGAAAAWRRAEQRGLEALHQGAVAAFVVAGGQGTRLGFDGPKGSFPIGPVTDRTLFKVHAEKVLAASRRFERDIPFLVMTSGSNDADTRCFFQDNSYFGLSPDQVRIFRQGEMPAVNAEGKLILESAGRIFVSPNGHGGSLKALWDSQTIEWLEERGVELISYFQVDNPLVKVIDPAFLGFHLIENAEASLKLLRRTIPEEKLGIWVRMDGLTRVIEYIDMPGEKMAQRDDDGRLRYSGGSIAINCFSVSFVRRLSEKGFRLPFHRASKKIPYVDENGRRIEPDVANGTKFETFVFDSLLFTQRAIGVETTRREEFSPVKNAEGVDSPETARRDMSRLYGDWLKSAGARMGVDQEGYPPFPIELSPLYADSPAALRQVWDGPEEIDAPLLLEWRPT